MSGGEIIGIVLFIILFGCIAVGVSSAIGDLLTKRRREQFGKDGWDDEWRDD